MPPKAKKTSKKKGDKSAKKEKDIENAPISSDNDEIFEFKEDLLKEKLSKITQEIVDTKLEMEKQNERNKILELECEKARSETEVFINYLNDLEEQRKRNLVTLNDYNESMIENYEKIRHQMSNNFENKKSDLQFIFETKDKTTRDLMDEIRTYDEYLIIREKQHKEISDLENQIKNIRCQQAVELEKMKVHLITEHQKFQQESNEKINEIARAAYKEALESLTKACKNTESENRELRQEMLWTIGQNKLLNERKIELLRENRNLREEYQYAVDFASFRQIRQEKPKQLEQMNKNKQ